MECKRVDDHRLILVNGDTQPSEWILAWEYIEPHYGGSKELFYSQSNQQWLLTDDNYQIAKVNHLYNFEEYIFIPAAANNDLCAMNIYCPDELELKHYTETEIDTELFDYERKLIDHLYELHPHMIPDNDGLLRYLAVLFQ